VKNTNFKNIKKTLKKGLYKKNTIYISRINNHRPGGLYQFNKLFKMKNNKTKAERIEDKLTLTILIIGLAYFIVMACRLFLNF